MVKESVFILFNGNQTDKETFRKTITESLQKANYTIHFVEAGHGAPFHTRFEQAVEQAKKENALIVAAGGDGTVNAVAALCYKHTVSLGIIPLGTFNYFARELQIPTDLEGALEVITKGVFRDISAGMLGDRLFLNNASFGLYPKLIRQREQASARFGRIRIIAAFSAALSLLRQQKLFAIKITADGKEELRRTNMVFIGNNTMQLENLGLHVAKCTAADTLAVIIMRPLKRFEAARILFRGAIGTLKEEEKIEEFCAHTLEVETKRKHIELVIDGEIIQMRAPLSFRIAKNALRVKVPALKAST